MEIRQLALDALRQPEWTEKAHILGLMAADRALDVMTRLEVPVDIPGRPAAVRVVSPSALRTRSVHTTEGRAGLIHALAHIEFNAINLALDIVWRFSGLPVAFYRDWVRVAQKESEHFRLLNEHLRTMGYAYGDFPAHDGLWEMAMRTQEDLLARLALVPRTLEARGLDASPQVRHKLASGGDPAGAAIIDIILRDEIGHVGIGNCWYRWVCEQRGLEVVATYAELAKTYRAPVLKGPFNLEARRAAGFDEQELALLQSGDPAA